MINIKNCFFKYNDKMIFEHYNLKLFPNEIILIKGKSGIGKTTLLNLISGLINPYKGEIVSYNISVSRLNEKYKSIYRNENIGYIYQNFNLINWLSVKKNIFLPVLMSKNNKNNINNKLIEKLEINNFINKKPEKLSGGEKQRAAISRAFIKNPKIILADEPDNNLDVNNKIIFKELLIEHHKNVKDSIIIIVSHNDEFNEIATRKISIN